MGVESQHLGEQPERRRGGPVVSDPHISPTDPKNLLKIRLLALEEVVHTDVESFASRIVDLRLAGEGTRAVNRQRLAEFERAEIWCVPCVAIRDAGQNRCGIDGRGVSRKTEVIVFGAI